MKEENVLSELGSSISLLSNNTAFMASSSNNTDLMASSSNNTDFMASSLTKDFIMHGEQESEVFVIPWMLQRHMNNLINLSTSLMNSDRESDPRPKQQGFGNLLVEKDDVEFFRNLRVTKETFILLLNQITKKYTPIHRGGNVPVGAKLALELCLWYLGNKEPYRKMAELFGVSESAVFKSVQTVTNIICSLGSQFINWPIEDKLKEVENKFKNVCGFPGIVGAIDGIHIEIKAPVDVQADFINQTNRHSVILMAVCDSEKRFIFIDAGYPGSAHDSTVLENTQLYHLMGNSPSDLFPSNYHHIIGDSAFQLSSYLLVPYTDFGILSETQEKYNNKLSQTRCVIENAFAFLKGRFRRLEYIDADLSRIPNIITACCIIHNITLDNASEEEFLCNEGELLPVPEMEEPAFDNELLNLPDIHGSVKRDFIASLLTHS